MAKIELVTVQLANEVVQYKNVEVDVDHDNDRLNIFRGDEQIASFDLTKVIHWFSREASDI